MTNADLYARCAEALSITREHFAAWIDGDPFAGYDLAAVPGDALETLHARGIITADELRWFESDETPADLGSLTEEE